MLDIIETFNNYNIILSKSYSALDFMFDNDFFGDKFPEEFCYTHIDRIFITFDNKIGIQWSVIDRIEDHVVSDGINYIPFEYYNFVFDEGASNYLMDNIITPVIEERNNQKLIDEELLKIKTEKEKQIIDIEDHIAFLIKKIEDIRSN
jgi:hypothetical protein